ncbi:hypothetical protein FPQ18DRAFT_304748 [Pyronema domesticum]|nr:hypothetical protein FPQ18DRAFT_304748 [Pyronema domesticum]
MGYHHIPRTTTVAFSVLALSSVVEADTRFSNDPKTPRCLLMGDPDIYGLGVRLGFYLQYLSALIALMVDPKSVHSARTGLNIFTLAILINQFRSTDWEGSILMPEYFMIINLTLGLTFCTFPYPFDLKDPEIRPSSQDPGVGDPNLRLAPRRRSTTWLKPDRAQTFQESSISIGITGLMYSFKRQNHGMLPECPVVIPFFFASIKTSNKHWQRFIKVLGAMLPMSVLMTLIGILALWVFEFIGYRARSYQPKPELPEKSRDFDLKSESIHTLLPRVIFAGSAIAMIELTISKNRIDLSAAPITSTVSAIKRYIAIKNKPQKNAVEREAAGVEHNSL